MSLTSQGRAAAMYAAVQANNPDFGQLSSGEQAALRANMQAIFGDGDLTYLITNTVVLPASFQAQAGATVATPTGNGSVITPAAIVGTGKIS